MNKKPVVYIAGPMRGIKYFNTPAFDEAEKKLLILGFEVINPASLDRDAGCNPMDLAVPDDFDWMTIPEGQANGNTIRDVFLRDTQVLCTKVDIIYRLRGWQNSTGAQAEVALGKALRLMFMEDLF